MNRLEECRKAVHMTRRKLADLLGVIESTVYGWERENTHPRQFQINRMEQILGVNPGELELRASAFQYRYATREDDEAPDVEYCDSADLEPLLYAIDGYGEACLREVVAYLGPQPLHITVRRLKKGKVTSDELDVIRRVLRKYGG